MPTRRIPTVLVLAALGLGLAGCRWPWGRDDAHLPITLSGTIDAREVDLSFQAPGRIRELDTDEGRTVRAGAVVAELDPVDLAWADRRASAQAASASQALAALVAGSRPEEVREARAAARQAEADQHYADLQVTRTRELIEQKFVSPDQLDRVVSTADAAAARLDQARQALALLVEGARREDIDRARADADAAQAAANSARQQLSYAQLSSPVDGVVSVRLAESGQVVAAGAPVLRVAEMQHPWVRAYLAEEDLARVRLGDPAEVRVDGLPGQVFHGRLSFVAPEAEFTPKTVETKALRVDLVYRVTVDIDDGSGRLKIGMPADVTFTGK